MPLVSVRGTSNKNRCDTTMMCLFPAHQRQIFVHSRCVQFQQNTEQMAATQESQCDVLCATEGKGARSSSVHKVSFGLRQWVWQKCVWRQSRNVLPTVQSRNSLPCVEPSVSMAGSLMKRPLTLMTAVQDGCDANKLCTSGLRAPQAFENAALHLHFHLCRLHLRPTDECVVLDLPLGSQQKLCAIAATVLEKMNFRLG